MPCPMFIFKQSRFVLSQFMQTSDFDFTREFTGEIPASFRGFFDIAAYKFAVILNSRQSKTPCGNDPWIVNTQRAVMAAIEKGYAILTSIGMNTWELALWAAASQGGKQVVVLPDTPEGQFDMAIKSLIDDFELDRSKTGWLTFPIEGKARSRKIAWPLRDKLALEHADLILPVSIRPKGNLDRLVAQFGARNDKDIINDFRVEYRTKERPLSPVRGEINKALAARNWDYITHWTHSCHDPWPGQKSSDFYKNLRASGDRYPNDALGTLKNILRQKLLRGSATNMRGGLRAVAFSKHPSQKVVSLMRWRKRYVRWNFELYGIAIARKTAVEIGIRPVIYGKPEIYKRLAEADKPYFQSEGIDGGDWREEAEWRFVGDLDISNIDSRDLLIIVATPDEIEPIKQLTDAEVVSFT